MGCVPPLPGFLAGLREICDRAGALLIFDEVMTGFRVAWGGAQRRFRVRPDLTCLGKVVGGGLPAAAYGGRRELMKQMAPEGPVYQAGTLSGNPLAMAAGLETLKRLGDRLAGLDGVERVVSLFSALDVHRREGDLVIEPFLSGIPDDPAALARVRERVLANPVYAGNLVSRSGRATALIIHLEQMTGSALSESGLHGRIQEVVAEERGDLEAWLSGRGCVPLYDLMEDAATAEISRAQIWQQLKHNARLADGRIVDLFLVRRILAEELTGIREAVGEPAFSEGRFELAASIFERLVTSPELEDFLTLVAYDHI